MRSAPPSRNSGRWGSSVIPNEWTKLWPSSPGLYWFYGYPINKQVDSIRRLLLVNVEYSGPYGIRARTLRSVLKAETGCTGYWLPINVPRLPRGLKDEEVEP